MAYSSVRVQFEIGHEASVRNKRTPEGFTHDWEVFVRGADNTEIQCFVEKVVFYLHETFQKPKRVVKEPPYSVKECGYAGFVLPIDVYLRNKEEPKKISFQYDLQLQSSGPPISRVLREPRVFQNPSEDFRRKLIRGGGVGVDSPPEDGKPPRKPEEIKLIPPKKHKPDLPLSNSFADLFGTPIRRVTPELKKAAEVVKKDLDKKKVSKPIAVKDEKEYSRDKEKDKVKDRDKSKDKPKRPPSPPPVPKVKEEPKKSDDREKKKEESGKFEKERKEKHKEKESEKSHKKDKRPKEVEVVKRPVLTPVEKPPLVALEQPEDTVRDRPEKEKHKHRHKKKEKEKSREKEKHKHKEKESKERSVEKVKRKEEERVEKRRSPSPPSPSPPPVEPPRREKQHRGPLGALFSELSDSASPVSDDDDPPRPAPEPKFPPVSEKLLKETDKKSKIVKEEKTKKEKSPKKRSGKNESESESKRLKLEKREASLEREREREREREAELAKRQREEQEKREREEEERKSAEREEEERRVKLREEEMVRKEKEKADAEAAQKTKTKKEKEGRKKNREKVVAAEEEETSVIPEPAPVQLSEDYLSQLRVLQQRIMSLEDNAELQKVVKVIAESGQYEVTKKTFDFDLCTLDQVTVRRLQDFFRASS